MQDRVTFPDFSAFQIEIPYGSWLHESGRSGGHPTHEISSDFWPDVQVSHDREPSDAAQKGS
jgi:hypothetical protein